MRAVGGDAEPMQFRCEACEYAYELDHQLSKPARLQQKVVDDIISLEDVMKNAPQTKGAAATVAHALARCVPP
jgi:hypothetical protein